MNKQNKINNEQIIDLELHDKYSYKKPFKAQWKGLDTIDIIFEILGSVEKYKEDLDITIQFEEHNLFIYHNGKPVDKDDISRLMALATHKLNKNRKGVSKQGVGWRAVATISSNKNFSEGYDINNFFQYSSMLSKLDSDIPKTESDIPSHSISQLEKDEVICFIHDNDFKIRFCNSGFYNDIYNRYLEGRYGVLFIIPFDTTLTSYDDHYIEHKLKLLFNRLDCKLTYNNVNNKYSKQVFENKPFYYVDRNIPNNRYLEVKCEMFTYYKKKILKMNIVYSKNIIDPDNELIAEKDHYFWINTHRSIDEVMQKYEYNDWIMDIEDTSKLVPDDYIFYIRMMGFDPDNHGNNEGFKKWWKYYSPFKTKGKGIEGYGDGIIPYINNHCLKYSSDASQKGYLKQPKFYPSKKLLIGNNWQGKDSGTNWERSFNNKTITYKKNQNFLCEYIEGFNTDSEKSFLTINPIKSKTSVCDTTQSKGYSKTIPFFLLWLSHKYLWDITEEKIELTLEQKLKEAEQDKLQAQQKAKEEEQKKLQAQQKAKEEEQKKLQAIYKSSETNQTNERILELTKEVNKQKEDLEISIETDYIPIHEETNLHIGHCYCIFDPTRPSWRKIGKSSKSKEKLMKQYISRYMPEPITIIQWTGFDNSKLAEEHIFEKLKKYRHASTEWFKFNGLSDMDINKVIKDIFEGYDYFITNEGNSKHLPTH